MIETDIKIQININNTIDFPRNLRVLVLSPPRIRELGLSLPNNHFLLFQNNPQQPVVTLLFTHNT